MATIIPIVTSVYGHHNIDGWQIKWGPMANGDVGAAVGTTIGNGAGAIAAPGGGTMAGFADKTAQAVGTFGAGGTVAIEGSNDGGVNWFQLSNAQAATIALTLASLQEVIEACIWYRPHIVGGDGTTSLTVTMFFRKTQTP